MKYEIGDTYIDENGLYGVVDSVDKHGDLDICFMDGKGNEWNEVVTPTSDNKIDPAHYNTDGSAVKPQHYNTDGEHDLFYYFDNGLLTPEQRAGFYIGNVIKYVIRHEKKNGLEDLKKAKRYIDKLEEKYK